MVTYTNKMQCLKQRVFPLSLAPNSSAFPLLPASRPPSATPPHAARGPYLSSSHWSFVRVARGPARLVAPSGLMPLFLREGRGGSRGVGRRGSWARRWHASNVESEAKRRPKQHSSAIDPQVLIFIGELAASSQHCQHTCCDSLIVSIDQRWPDIETQPNRDIPKPQVQKTMRHSEITVTKAVVI